MIGVRIVAGVVGVVLLTAGVSATHDGGPSDVRKSYCDSQYKPHTPKNAQCLETGR